MSDRELPAGLAGGQTKARPRQALQPAVASPVVSCDLTDEVDEVGLFLGDDEEEGTVNRESLGSHWI